MSGCRTFLSAQTGFLVGTGVADAIGYPLTIDGQLHEGIGVAPAAFGFPGSDVGPWSTHASIPRPDAVRTSYGARPPERKRVDCPRAG
jgi:hypothetical protein